MRINEPMAAENAPVYLDCNSTTPVDARVEAEIVLHLSTEFGNAGSRTHDFGLRAKKAVQTAREEVAQVLRARAEEVIFTSGATESNNLAIFGLAQFGERVSRQHIVTTQIEHKAVLEPLAELARRGFEITYARPTGGGWVDPEEVRRCIRPDTLLVSVMQINNETGVVQPIPEIADLLADQPLFFHVDAAQGFGKQIAPLRNPRIDLLSISAHKIFGPKGVGALVMRRRGYERPPLTPLLFGGGQERGLRAGTLPVALIVGLGLASRIAASEAEERAGACRRYRRQVLDALLPLDPVLNGDQQRVLPHVLNLSFPGLDSEAVILALKDIVAISNGSACTSQSYSPSHVLAAMGVEKEVLTGAIRLSWSHSTEGPDWNEIAEQVKRLR